MARIFFGTVTQLASAQRAHIHVGKLETCDQHGPLFGLDRLDGPDSLDGLARSAQKCLAAQETGALPKPLSHTIEPADVSHGPSVRPCGGESK
jgi:hypothetical protein